MDPIVYADLHVTDGAQFEHDVSLNVAPTLAGDARALRQAAVGLRDGLMRRLAAQGSLPLDFYPSFIKDDDPASGFAVSVGPPRFSQEYWAERQRIGVLVETHSWKPYPVRVRVTRHAIVGWWIPAAADGASWLDAARRADCRGAALGGTAEPLRYQAARSRPAARVPRLCLPPRGLADLRRHRDALRFLRRRRSGACCSTTR